VVRFKVVKGSHLLLVFAATLLILAIGGLVVSYVFDDRNENVSAQASLVSEQMTQMNSEAETDAVFASLALGSPSIELDPEKDGDISIELLPDTERSVDRPSILIYHTHTHEAYEQNESEPYEAVAAWRTKDADQSVVRIGAELAEKLRKKGFNVVHDVTDHELDDLSTAYERSLATLKGYEEPFDLYIDLHRDAYSEGLQMGYIADSGETAAQIMLLVGKGNGFEEKPYYSENYIFAQKLTQRINDVCPGICREVLVKDGRYNQHIGIFSILVEIGHNRNTLTEALNAVSPLAEGIYDLFVCQPDILIEGIMKDKAF